MKRAIFRFNSSEIPMLADQILHNYKRDKSYFERYSTKFNNDFLVRFEERVNALVNRKSHKTFNDRMVHLNKNIDLFISSFSPFLENIEIFLHRSTKVAAIRGSDFSFSEVNDALNRRCFSELKRSCLKLISQIELHTENFIDKGFILILIHNFRLFMSKMISLECELAELTHRHDQISDEYLFLDHQLKNFIETIIESTPAVFGDDDAAKREEYSIEKLMMQTQINRSQTQ